MYLVCLFQVHILVLHQSSTTLHDSIIKKKIQTYRICLKGSLIINLVDTIKAPAENQRGGKHFTSYRHICTSFIVFSMQLEWINVIFFLVYSVILGIFWVALSCKHMWGSVQVIWMILACATYRHLSTTLCEHHVRNFSIQYFMR